MANIVWNYSPFIAPTTRSAKPTAKLRRALGAAAHDMLEEFLRKWRRVRGDSGAPAVHAVRGPPLPLWVRRLFFLAHAFADRRHGTRKAVRAGRENDRPLRVARRVGRRSLSGGRVRLPRDRTVRRAVQSIFQTRRRRSVTGNVVQVRFLHVHVQFLAISKRTISFFFFADLSRANGQIPKLPIRSQTCLRCSQHGVTVR